MNTSQEFESNRLFVEHTLSAVSIKVRETLAFRTPTFSFNFSKLECVYCRNADMCEYECTRTIAQFCSEQSVGERTFPRAGVGRRGARARALRWRASGRRRGAAARRARAPRGSGTSSARSAAAARTAAGRGSRGGRRTDSSRTARTATAAAGLEARSACTHYYTYMHLQHLRAATRILHQTTKNKFIRDLYYL